MRSIGWLAITVNPNRDGPMTRTDDHPPVCIRRAARNGHRLPGEGKKQGQKKCGTGSDHEVELTTACG